MNEPFAEGLALGDARVYGIGKSNQIISYLEEGNPVILYELMVPVKMEVWLRQLLGRCLVLLALIGGFR